MKKTKVGALLLIIFLALAFTAGESEKQSSSSTEESSITLNQKVQSYVPSLPFVGQRNDPGHEVNVQQKKRLKTLGIGKGSGQLGVSKEEEDLPPMGPGSFAYSKKKKSFIILDNQNNRINFYPENVNDPATSVTYPQHRLGLGLTVDQDGTPILLAKTEDATGRVDHSYFEVWTLGDERDSASWKIKQKFSFSSRDTHYAAQSLEMQTFGDALLFKGLNDNEFHVLEKDSQRTRMKSGFPVKDGLIRLESDVQSDGSRNIRIRHVQSPGKTSELRTHEDIERLNSFRVLPNGTLAIDLEADDEKGLPREVVLIDSKTGAIKGRTPIRSKNETQIDQDLFFQDSSLFQLAESPNSKDKNDKFGIFQTQFEDD